MTQNRGAKAQGVLGGEGGVGEDASGAVCPPYTDLHSYILTRPRALEGIARVGRKREARYGLLTALGMDAQGRLALGYERGEAGESGHGGDAEGHGRLGFPALPGHGPALGRGRKTHKNHDLTHQGASFKSVLTKTALSFCQWRRRKHEKHVHRHSWQQRGKPRCD